MIYHVTGRSNWLDAVSKGYYEAASLPMEGFIHASHSEQVKGVLERYYRGQKDLLLLHIDESRLQAELKNELSLSVHEVFPHIYGPLNIDAVVRVEEIIQHTL